MTRTSPKRTYPRWQNKTKLGQLFYVHKNLWEYEVGWKGDGKWLALCPLPWEGKKPTGYTKRAFNTREQAVKACEDHYRRRKEAEDADFQAKLADWLAEVPRVQFPEKGNQASIPGPVIDGKRRDGRLTIRRSAKSIYLRWRPFEIDGFATKVSWGCAVQGEIMRGTNWREVLDGVVARSAPGGWCQYGPQCGSVSQAPPETAALIFKLLHALYAKTNRAVEEKLKTLP
jgi:hypothetical protein